MHQGLEQQMPSFNLPSKILCKVVNVQHRAEPETDEFYAQITLLPPEPDQSEVTIPDPPPPVPEKCTVHSFCKTLTPSDTSTHGYVPQPSWQELVATDPHGNKWHFWHIFRGQSRRRLLLGGVCLLVQKIGSRRCIYISERRKWGAVCSSKEAHEAAGKYAIIGYI